MGLSKVQIAGADDTAVSVATAAATDTGQAALLVRVVSQLGAGSGLVPQAFDYISYTSASTTDTYVYKTGGSGGTTVATVTVTWTDSTKTVLSTVART